MENAQADSNPLWQPFFLESGEKAILLCHGFTGTPATVLPLGEALHAAGYTVRGILLPGHGVSLEAMLESDDTQWFYAIERAYLEMKSRYEKVAVAGLSMGGALALRIAELYPVDACIAYAPALRFRHWYSVLAPIVKYVVPTIPWKTDRRTQQDDFLSEYNTGYEGVPVAKVEDIMRIYRMTRRDLPKIKCPLLVVQSDTDEQVHPSVADTIERRASSEFKEIIRLQRSPHVCVLGAERDMIFRRSIEFLDKYL
ncbi:MAG: alpha/beta fold hydrolase [Oscillospiraceae bacterium]|jgi:carboxylesterase|nr:alpha/beta fold hydrolase [Oscillospiraceae bacterium]